MEAKRTSGLLRLFRSDLFSAWMGLQYLLSTPPHQAGTHYYLCNRLRNLPPSSLLPLLPQLCHFMVNSRKAVSAVECLVMEWCRRDVHVSVTVLWLLEAYLEELTGNDTTTSPQQQQQQVFRVNRLLQQMQSASFSRTDPSGTRSHYSRRRRSSLMLSSTSTTPDAHGVDEPPAVPGTILGFGLCLLSFAVPEVWRAMRPLAMMEARAPHCTDGTVKRRHLPTPFTTPSPTIEQLHKGAAFQPPSATLLPVTAIQNQQQPLRLYHGEMQFVSSLLQVSMRICRVPGKEGRQRALHAELNLINHNLPADICLPLRCHNPGTDGNKHHRIVRIPSHEATILNSAERVPFLVFIETVSESDLSMADLMAMRGGTVSHFSSASSINTPTSSVSDTASTTSDQQQQQPEPEVDLIEARTPLFACEESDTCSQQPPQAAEQMRLAAIMLAQLNRQASQPNANHRHIDDIRQRLLSEIERLERDGMIDALTRDYGITGVGDSIDIDISDTKSDKTGTTAGTTGKAHKQEIPAAINNLQVLRDDPSAAVFTESYSQKCERVRRESPFGHLPTWSLVSVVVKAGVEMRQELFACQLIAMCQQIWTEEGIDELWTSPHHNVLVAGRNGGLLETIPDCISVHSIKKASLARDSVCCTLKQYYTGLFGEEHGGPYKQALLNFIQSLAAYSLITYILHIKDRHNGNILIDRSGHIIHIDFGFMLTNAPGGNAYVGGFETAPFKLTHDYVELLGGLRVDSPEFCMFRALFMTGLLALRKHHERLVLLVEATSLGPVGKLPCFQGASEQIIASLKARLFLASTDRVVEQNVDRLITSSAYNMFTRLYDSFQYYSNGIL